MLSEDKKNTHTKKLKLNVWRCSLENYNMWDKKKYTGWFFYCRLDATEEKTSELRDTAIETIQNEAEREKKKDWEKSE